MFEVAMNEPNHTLPKGAVLSYAIRTLLIGVAACFAGGCTPSQNPGGGGDSSAFLDLGSNGVFDVGEEGILTRQFAIDISNEIPTETPESATLSLAAADINVADGSSGTDVGTSGVVVVTLRLISDLNTNACEAGSAESPIVADHVDNVITEILPASVDASTTGLQALLAGRFNLCVSVSTTQPQLVTIDRIGVEFAQPQPIVANSCAEILAMPQVQDALAQLDDASLSFSIPQGGQPSSIVGSYSLMEETTFDPDGSDTGRMQSGTIDFSNQQAQTINRTGFGSTVSEFIVGDATSVGLCTINRTNGSLCDQTIARLESLVTDPESGNLSGQFLSVAVRRHGGLSPSCGATGDFVFGDVSFTSQSAMLARRIARIAVPDTITPDLLQLAPSGDIGVFSDVGSGVVTQFDTIDPFELTTVPTPESLSPLGTSALGYSRTGAVLSVITDRPDAGVSFNAVTLNVIRQTETTTADYIGEVVDFDLDETRVYVPATSPDFSDRITILRTDDSVFADEVRRMQTPDDDVPVYARLSPDGSLLATLLEDQAPIGQAGKLIFANVDRTTPNFIIPPINLVNDAGGTALAQQLVFTQDGSRVFLAGLGAVVSIETTDPFTISRIDVSDGAGDNPIALALSGDGKVLAVAVDDDLGDVNFAIVDVATEQVVHTAKLEGIDKRGAVDIAHFDVGRVAIVANAVSRVVAIQTESPFTTSQPLSVADVTDQVAVGRLAASGSIIAVSNVDEPAIYLFEFPQAP
ncbi:MAG TPA: hypothetical protein PKN33_17055 [Phycisphaerae bacterium]|nr:hypothetical protein [Phycisphaerae bacterium]